MGNCIEPEKDASKSDVVNLSARSKARSNLIHNITCRQVADDYEVVHTLGEGSMGCVSLVRKKTSAVGGSAYKEKVKGIFGTHVKKKTPPLEVQEASMDKCYALKSIILSRISEDFLDEMKNEIAILKSMDHPNIVKMLEVYESRINIYIVLENCEGGDLYSRCPYSEKSSAKIIGKLLSALAYMHEHNICHRDLKFENIMFESHDEDAEIKVIDFGLSKKYSPNRKLMNEGVGTVYTMAPEVLRGSYTSQADLWSAGVITFMLLANEKPFRGKKRKKVIQRIMQLDYNFNKAVWETHSPASKDFVKALLEVNPKKRLTAAQALDHEWQQQKFSLNDRAPSQEILNSCHESIANYRDVSAFKKMALMVIAHKSNRSEILELRQVFDSIDTANNGSVSFDEFKVAMQKSNSKYTEAEIKLLFENVDTGNDGRIYYTEFLAATLGAHGRIVEERLAEAFDRLDSDDTGYISKENLKEILGVDYTEEKVEQLLSEGDLTGDGKISFEEFQRAFISPTHEREKSDLGVLSF